MSRRIRLVVLFIVAFLYACESGPPTDVPGIEDPRRAISDGAHSDGNDRFYFLPPMVPLPDFTAAFNPSLLPLIEICDAVDAGSSNATDPDPLNEPAFCANPLAVYTLSTGTDGEIINVSTTDEHYHVNWHTDRFPSISPDVTYRIRVFIHQFDHAALADAADPASELPQLLGYADVELAENMRELTNLDSGETIGLVDGRTLPIKARIEQGASCSGTTDCGEGVVNSNGGTVTTEDQTAGVSVPEGAVDNPILIKIKRLNPAAQPGGRCLPSHQPQREGCYNFDTEPEISEVNNDGFEKFRELVTVGVCLLEPGDGYSLHKFSRERPEEGVIQLPEAAAPFLDCTNFSAFVGVESTYYSRFAAATGRLLGPVLGVLVPRVLYAGDQYGGLDDNFSDYGHLKPVTLQKGAGDTQTGSVGTTLPIAPTVTATEDHVEPNGTAGSVEDVGLEFTATDPLGKTQVVASPVITAADGTASNAWTLSTSPGVHTLTVRVAGEPRQKASTVINADGSVTLDLNPIDPVVFTAMASVPASGTIADPAGDVNPGAPDLVSGSIDVSGGDAQLSVRFAPGTFDAAVAFAQFTLDIDQDETTGHPGVDAGEADSDLMGTDFLVELGSSCLGSNARVKKYAGTPNSFTAVSNSIVLTVVADGMDVTVPRGLLDSDDGAMNFKVAVSSETGPSTCAYSGVQDYMTDIGSAPGQVELATVWATISAASDHTCATTTSSSAYCWGENHGGKLGDGTTTDALTPVEVSGGLSFGSVSAGELHGCGVATDGSGYCWGRNDFGNLGDGTTTDRLTPTLVQGGLAFAAVSAGELYTCGVTTSGAVYCWGANSVGELGDGTTTNRASPTQVSGGIVFSSVTTGRSAAAHTCGVSTGGNAYCWGRNASGELGTGSAGADMLVPQLVSGGHAFESLEAGRAFTCGVTNGGEGYCWGTNSAGQLGDGTTTARAAPTKVTGGLAFLAISAGYLHACGVTSAGDAYCWGDNTSGQLGNGTNADELAPALVAGGLEFSSISAGADHTCAVTTGGDAYCWGSNFHGALGDGSGADSLTPTPVAQPSAPIM